MKTVRPGDGAGVSPRPGLSPAGQPSGYGLAMDEVQRRYFALGPEPGAPPPINLCIGASAFDVRPYVDLRLDVAERRDTFRYGAPEGTPGLRSRLSALYAAEYGLDIDPRRFCVTDGASGGLVVAMASLVGAGDEVILPAVHYPPFTFAARLLGARCVFAPVDATLQYDVEAVAALVTTRTRAIVVNSPGNPHGASLSRAALERLVSLGVPVISDEVYAMLAGAPEPRPTSLLELGHDHFVLGSFSKTYGVAGFRLGYVVAPEAHVDRVADLQALFAVCTSLPVQILGERLLAAHREIAAAHLDFLKERRDLVAAACREHGLDLVVPPRAAFFALVDTSRQGRGSTEIAFDLVRRCRLAVAPGSDFARPDPRFLRLNYAAAERLDILRAALDRLTAYLNG